MASATTGRVALFSIHPRYADALLDGTKMVEFRRQGLPDDVTHIVIYATAPTQRVVGEFTIDGIDKTTPARAWKKYGSVGGIEKTPFERYYTGAPHAFVIRAAHPRAYTTPIALTDLDPAMRPPQSYLYLTEPLLRRIHDLTQHTHNGRLATVGRAIITAGRNALTLG